MDDTKTALGGKVAGGKKGGDTVVGKKQVTLSDVELDQLLRCYAEELWGVACMRARERKSGEKMNAKMQVDRIMLGMRAAGGLVALRAMSRLEPMLKLRERLAASEAVVKELRLEMKELKFALKVLDGEKGRK